jgi:hypothetical protein
LEAVIPGANFRHTRLRETTVEALVVECLDAEVLNCVLCHDLEYDYLAAPRVTKVQNYEERSRPFGKGF